MKTAFTVSVMLALAGMTGTSALAQTPSGNKSVCIRAADIDHTETPDNSTILFYMRGHKVWKNTLASPCFNLKNNFNGFTYVLDPTNEICSNLQSIHMNDTGAVCLLGDFTPVEPAPAAH